MPPVVLGLDIGGANLKAATADKRASSVPFPLWKQPDRLPAVLAGLVRQFPDAEEFAVTMTGELCDCFETKRQGVNAILTAVQNVSRSYPIRVWSTDGKFLMVDEARRDYLKVASANWHALATFAGEYVPEGKAILIDIGSTTSDIIPILDGKPVPRSLTDTERLGVEELVYTGVRRTPVCAILGFDGAAEFFATTLDVYLLLGMVPEDPGNTDTADGRPATRYYAHARMSRMVGGDPELAREDMTLAMAQRVYERQVAQLTAACDQRWFQLDGLRPSSLAGLLRGLIGKRGGVPKDPPEHKLKLVRAERGRHRITYICCGAGEFLAQQVRHSPSLDDDSLLRGFPPEWDLGTSEPHFLSLNDRLGPAASTCAPAYALAVLATERRA